MPTTSDAPADTTMMRIVHDALRRDLARASTTLARSAPGASPQRRAIGAHLGWIVGFLRAHHASEDDGLYRLTRERGIGDDAALAVLDRMERQHEEITPALADLEEAASVLARDGSDDASRCARAAIDALLAVLLPHLREEEDEAMPVVGQLITAGEWQEIEQEHNLDPKSMAELGFEGHWLIDDASEADRATVVGLVPPIPRFILLKGFARRYRRHSEACWGEGSRPGRSVQLANDVSVTVDAEIDEVWSVVSDVTRVGEWSHECIGAEWIDPPGEAVPGARFRGRNRAGLLRWGRVCEIVAVEPYELVWRTVPTAAYPDSSEWNITLARDGTGTRISEGFHVIRAPRGLALLFGLVIPAHRDRTAALTGDLRRLGAVATASRAAPDPAGSPAS